MESAQEELPQLHTSNDRQDEVNDRVETYRQSVIGRRVTLSMEHSTYLLERNPLSSGHPATGKQPIHHWAVESTCT